MLILLELNKNIFKNSNLVKIAFHLRQSLQGEKGPLQKAKPQVPSGQIGFLC